MRLKEGGRSTPNRSILIKMDQLSISELNKVDLFPIVQQVFDKAFKEEKLIYNESDSFEILEDGNLKFKIEIVGGLSKRPSNRPQEPGIKTNIPRPRKDVHAADPFMIPEPELTVVECLADEYRLILNKYPNTSNHFLLVTREFVKQDSLLTPKELATMYFTLQNLGRHENYFTFFNSGSESGYSQYHKHVQFMPFPKELQNIFVDDLVRGEEFYLPKDTRSSRQCLNDPNCPYQHYVLPLPKIPFELEEAEEQLGMAYMVLFRKVLNCFKYLNSTNPFDVSYNLLMTTKWIMIIPRRNAKFDKVWTNALAFIGLFLAKDTEIQGLIKEYGPSTILQENGFPNNGDVLGDENDY